MGNIWFISDTHFGHENILNFKTDGLANKVGVDGNVVASKAYLRPDFSNISEMDETMIENWNSVVQTNDKVYHLGDVCMCSNTRMMNILGRLNGRKRLIIGNHDDVKGTPLLKYFQKATVWRIFKEHNFVCTHIPIALTNFRMVQFNMHGHTHAKRMGYPYINVCVEARNFTPVHLDQIKDEIKILGEMHVRQSND